MKKTNYNNVFREGNDYYTKSLIKPAKSVYGEKIIGEYREWVGKRSKLGAALHKNLRTFAFKKESTVLYLGASSGTTCSHLSDIVVNGMIFGVDLAPRIFYKFIELSKERKNLFPILADANRMEEYEFIPKCDVIFQDIAQKDQVRIFINNCEKFLKNDGIAYLSVKSRSIDVTKKPMHIFEAVKNKLKEKFIIIEERGLQPYEKDHELFVVKKKN
ncbi:MAG: fibrillarin-like rRNA/tRNA 2'-O-methyltransferase [Candidatus Nanoarchaeia archaeon]|nr:fibrillarin-like rRNA/tRNA 2'-O-methyltransferase [Candidatus Nanoarchaeia archaeon]MDD5499481.1 fibrillarin-like rRNA/tRNA 2'-O-methyltransferase [Candidatus Nanoarchaeia archaeon]